MFTTIKTKTTTSIPSKMTTTKPDPDVKPGAASLNLMKIVLEYGPIELAELDDKIQKHEREIASLKDQRRQINELLNVATAL